MLSFREASALARRLGTRLLAIYGLPCSGNSTLAAEIVGANGFQFISVDDFFSATESFLLLSGSSPEADAAATILLTGPA